MVSTIVPERRFKIKSKLPFVLVMVVAFAGGFAVSFLSRPATQLAEAKIQIADFRVEIPEGQTSVSILSREPDGRELAHLNIQRNGDVISGVPAVERRIAPRQPLSSDDAAFFRNELGNVFQPTDSVWLKANKIREWLDHRSYRMALPGLATRIPRQAYEQMKAGKPVLCGNLAEIYVALCESVGLTARAVGLSVALQNGMFGLDNHAGAEVWIPEYGGWVFQDPTFNCYWTIDGKPAGALALHEAVMSKKQMTYAPQTADTESRLRDYYIDPRLYFRHISYEYKAGGAVLYYANKRLEPLSITDKNWIHTGDPADIQRLDTEGQAIIERRSQVSPGIFVQLLGHDLFVRDRRERSQGIRVRSSSGAVEGCAYLHQRAEDLGLFNSANLVHNPAFRLTGQEGEVADDWVVSGPVEAMTVAGGQAIAALAGGRLWQRIQTKPGARYVMYARVSVSRGLVNWSLADPAHGLRSTGTVEPERVSEIVSEVIESESGYLDVGFDLPAGGSFRVMDVIVAEAPHFVPETERYVALRRRVSSSLR